MRFLFIYFLFLAQLAVAQVFDIDSLKRVLKSEQSPTKKIKIRSLIGEYGGIERATYWDSIIKDAKQIEYLYGITYGSFMQSLNYTKKGQYDKAVEFAEQSLFFSQKDRDSVWMGYSIEHLGTLNSFINEKQTALKYYNDAVKLYDSKKLSWRKGYVIIKLGEIHELDSNYVDGNEKYQEALQCFMSAKDSSGISIAYYKIGKLFKIQHQLDTSLHYLLKALDSRKNISDEYYLCFILNDLAFVYLDLGKKEIAYDYILKSQKESDRIGEKGLAFRDINFFLFRYYKSKKDYELALQYKEVADSLDKVLYNNSNDKAILRQQAKYIYDKEKELDEIENSKLIAIEREEKEKQQLVIYGTGFVLLLVLVFSVFLYNRFKVTQKQKKIIEAKEKETQLQKHLIEEKHKEITDSIHYAQRIQRALITPEKYIDKQLNKLNKNS
jgi:tetratricopeptide (TPR) repeat protein